jgi:hypothetical protein
MKHTVLGITVLAALAARCTSTEGASSAGATQKTDTSAAQLDKAKAEAKATVQTLEDYAYGQKAEFVARMRRELAEIQADLDRLATKVEHGSGEAKADAKAKLAAVHEKWVQAKKQLDLAESATESSWEDVKGSFKKSLDDLKDSIDKTRQWLSDKIAP